MATFFFFFLFLFINDKEHWSEGIKIDTGYIIYHALFNLGELEIFKLFIFTEYYILLRRVKNESETNNLIFID